MKLQIKFFLKYFLLLFCARLLLPYGDEPDFDYRVFSILFFEKSTLNPFVYFELFFRQYDWFISDFDLEKVLIRVSFTFFLIYSVLNLFLFLRSTFRDKKTADVKYRFNQELLIISLYFPGVWYYLGVFAEEQYTLVLALCSVLFAKSLFALSLVGVLMLPIDVGSAILFFSFIILTCVFRLSILKRGYLFSIVLVLAFAITSAILSMKILDIISSLPLIGEKAAHIYEQYTEIYDVNEKYPIYYRPIITFISMIFYLPESRVFFPVAYLYVFIALIIGIGKIIKTISHDAEIKKYSFEMTFALTSITLIICFPMILPAFANAKYYVFVIPYIFLLLGCAFDFKKLIIFNLILNVLVFVQLVVMKVIIYF